jgi:hypothetical protein
MKKSIGLLVLGAALAALVSGCTTEPTEDGSLTAVPSDSIQYHEIRIDAFSHYWRMQKSLATQVSGGSLVTVDDQDSIVFVDSILLSTLTYDKTAGLPEHVLLDVPNFYGGNFRIVYKASIVPKTFSCYFYNHGKTVEWVEPEDPGVFMYRSSTLIEEQGATVYDQVWYKVVDEIERMEPIRCGYIPGQGFYLGDRAYDDFALSPFSVGGEFVIRY